MGFSDPIDQHLADRRQGKNTQFALADLLRQSVYSRMAGYERLLKKSFASRRRAQAECLCHENSRLWWPPWHGLQSVQDFFSNLYEDVNDAE